MMELGIPARLVQPPPGEKGVESHAHDGLGFLTMVHIEKEVHSLIFSKVMDRLEE